MDVFERNKKVAIARWNKVISYEKKNIQNDSDSLISKSLLCGFLAGDGSVQVRKEKNFYHYQIDFFPDDLEMLNLYCSLIKKLYHKEPTITQKEKFFTARITSKTIVNDLTNIATFGLKNWNPPLSLFSILGAKEAWLKGFFSAEAYVGPKTIKIQTVNKEGMKIVSNLLLEVGIEHHFYNYFPKHKNYSSVSIIFINKKEARKKFNEKIGFCHKNKNISLKKSLNL